MNSDRTAAGERGKQVVQAITLRGHHLLCLQTFTGRGYDSSFVANMNQLVRRLEADPEQEIRLVATGDSICACCPFHTAAGCHFGGVPAEPRISRKDRLVLRLVGLAPGAVTSFRQANEGIAGLLHQNPQLEPVCGDCEWWGICRTRMKPSSS